MRCVTWEGGYREFSVFLNAPVIVTGAAAAAMRPWDDGGQSVISYVELDTDTAPQTLPISRAAPTQKQFITEQLLKVVSIAEADADVVDQQKVDQRFSELEQRMQTWARHLPDEEAQPHWARFRAARGRATTRALTAERKVLHELEGLVQELETLVRSSDWESASSRFHKLTSKWRAEEGRRRVSRGSAISNRFLAAESRGLVRQAEAKRDRAKVARVAVKWQLSAELEALAISSDWSVADRQYADIRRRWNRTGHFNRSDEAVLTEAYLAAESTYLSARSQARAEAAKRRDALERTARIAAKARLVAVLNRLAYTTDWIGAEVRFAELKQQWDTAGHFASEGEVELSVAFREAECAYVAARDKAQIAAAELRKRRVAEERVAEQELVVATAEDLARAPYWDAESFERLSLRWKTTGPPSNPELQRRFRDAYLIARGAGFKDAIRTRIQIIAAVEQLPGLSDWPERARTFVEAGGQWALAAWAGPHLEVPLEVRYETAVRAFLSGCNSVTVADAMSRIEAARASARSAGDLTRSSMLDQKAEHLRRLDAAIAQAQALTSSTRA